MAATGSGHRASRHKLNALASDVRAVDLLTDIARRYYLQNQTQIEIARNLGLDPSTVSRHLKRARDERIVHVEIRQPRRENVELGRAVAQHFGVARVVAAPTAQGIESVAVLAAEFIDSLLRTGMRLGVSWGHTLADVVHHLRPGAVTSLDLIQLAGGLNDPTPGIQGHELVADLAGLYPKSRVQYLLAPAIVASAAGHQTLLDDPAIQSALESAAETELALVGIGEMAPSGTLFRGRHVTETDWQQLVEAGAVGNMNVRFFDAAGRPVRVLDRRTIGLDWRDLNAIPTVLAVAAGVEKAAAIRGALLTGAVDVLVTDEQAAAALLAM